MTTEGLQDTFNYALANYNHLRERAEEAKQALFAVTDAYGEYLLKERGLHDGVDLVYAKEGLVRLLMVPRWRDKGLEYHFNVLVGKVHVYCIVLRKDRKPNLSKRPIYAPIEELWKE